MSSKTLASALCVALAALTPAALGAAGAPAGDTLAAPAAATFVPLPSNLKRRPAAPVATAPAKPAWQFPAPLTGNPPAETWLPPLLSDEDRKHRMEDDRALMVANRAIAHEIFNAGILQDELKAGQYDDMESQLDAVLAKFQADPAYELVLQAAANFAEQGHAHGYVSDTALIQAWVAARPKSPWAHYSAALRWSNKAWDDRGSGFAGSVSDLQWKMMHDDETQARSEIQAALKLNPRQPIAWVTLMNIDRSDTGSKLEQNTADFNQGSKLVPTSYLIANQYEVALEPRWMGDAGMMDDFAQSQLGNVDRNPRFWDLQGESLADSGCAACNDYHWDVSLKQYNAALAFADRPSWLASAGEAALRVHRYALAHALYDRALAYEEDEIYWRMYRDFTVELCDPSKTPEEVERYRRDMVAYAGLENIQYPREQDSCTVYQRELPWGKEPLADSTGMRVYAIDSIGHPDFMKEPQPTYLPGPVQSATSPDGAWVVSVTDSADKTHHLELQAKSGGKVTEIYTSRSIVGVGFTSDSKHILVSDTTQGNEGGCHYVDPVDPSKDANLKEMIFKWAADNHLAVDLSKAIVHCGMFANDQVLTIGLNGYADGKPVFRMFYYDTDSGRLAAAQH